MHTHAYIHTYKYTYTCKQTCHTVHYLRIVYTRVHIIVEEIRVKVLPLEIGLRQQNFN